MERICSALRWRFYSYCATFARMGLTMMVPSTTKRLVVFLTPGYNWRTGGVLSISNLYRESCYLTDIHHATVALCAVPGDPLHFLRYDWFENHSNILRLEPLLSRCRQLEFLLVHIPEYAVNRFMAWLDLPAATHCRRVPERHFNVLVQNIDQVQGQNVAGLARFGKVTCTTAHEAYSTQGIRKKLAVPLHKLSVYLNHEQYMLTRYESKENLLVVSPDPHPLRESLLTHLAASLPSLRIIRIQSMTFQDYKMLVSRAKWALTFGEGLDGYFAEPILSGGIGFAVFNDRFFTPEYSNLENVYSSWDDLQVRMVPDLQRLDNPVAYERCWRPAFDLLCSKYDVAVFRRNLRQFYLGDYTYP